MPTQKKLAVKKRQTHSEKFVYVIYIQTTPQKLWMALTLPRFTRQYWYGATQQSEWKKGSSWSMKSADNMVTDSGKVLDAKKNRKLVLQWRHERLPELKAEGNSRMTYDIEKVGKSVKLTVTHEMPKPGTKFLQAVSVGWPQLLSCLKTLLETGKPLKDIPGR